MFAGKFRSWMEAHLGRPKKNKQQKDKAKGASRGHAVDAAPADRASPQSPTPLTDLPASSHLHRGPLTAESLDSISTCPTTGSERGGLRPHVNLSSPESAYSTGYSTDGTSPGTSFPPEYYINLRTGTHYFHSLGAPPGLGGLPPGLPLPPGGLHNGLHNGLHSGLPHPGTLPLHLPPGLPPLPPALQPALQPHLNSRQTWGWPTGLVQQPDPPRLSYLTPGRSRKQQHQQQQHQQLLLEQQQQHLHLLQQQQHQHQQLLQQQQQMYHKQQQKQQQSYIQALSRTESSTEEDLVGKAARPSSTSSSTISSQSATSSARHWQPADCVSSPRARTRIRTNPWLPTSPAPTPNATPTPRTRSQQQHQQQQQQSAPQPAGRQGLGGCSSSLSLSSSSSYGSASDVSLQRRPGSVGAAVPGAVPGAGGRSRARGGARGAARPQPLFQLNEESPSVEDKPLPRMQPTPSQRPAAPPVANGNAAVGNGRSSRTSNRAPLRSASSSSRGAAKPRPPGRSSSCSGSSTSSASSRTANNGSPPNLSDNETEDVEDVTLNEMMGKFDESYVYEKETDILSDSDPTDVEDYGDDGGDEQTEEDDGAEMDFIDRGSITELCDDHQLVNRGHCTFHNFPPGRRQSSRRRAARREVSRDSASSRDASRDASVGSPRGGTRTPSDRRRRRSAPRQQSQDGGVVVPDVNIPSVNLNRIVMQRLLLRSAELGTGLGTRSAGNTPLSARRNQRPPPPPPAPHSRVADYALADADREADRKYRQLIMQAEHILVSMTSTPTGTPTGSPLPLRTPHYGTPPMSKRHVMPNLNRRLDYLKQGAPCGPPQGPYGPCPGGPASHCTSPLARDRRFNDNAEENRNRWSPLVMPRRALEDPELRRKQCFTPSPSDFRRDTIAVDPPPPAPGPPLGPPMDIRASPLLSSFQRRPCPDGASPGSTPGGRRRGPPPVPPPRTVTAPAAASPTPVQAMVSAPAPPPAAPRLCKPFQLNLQTLPLPPPPAHSPVTKGWTAIEASSSDSDGSVTPRPTRAILPLALDRRAKSTATTPTSSRPPLVTYKSVDHRLDMLDACPQSEPVKRKVYADSHTLDRLSKKLEHTEIMPRTPTTPTPLLDNEDTHRKNMLMETLQQLKQSLEIQSASLQAPS